MSELDTLLPSGEPLRLAGETLTILPLKVGQLPAFVRAVTPIVHQLIQPEIDWLELVGEQGDALLAALAVATGRPREWIDALNADEAIVLASTVVEINAGFFTRTVLPVLQDKAGALAVTMAVAGPK